MKKILTDKEISKLLSVSGGERRVDLCDEVIILFLLTTGVKVSTMGRMKVHDVMNKDGSWKDEVFIDGYEGKNGKEKIIFITNMKLRLALDDYCDVRLARRHGCTFDWQSFRGLNPDSLLLLNRTGKEFSIVYSDRNHEKHTVIQSKIRKIFEDAGVEVGPGNKNLYIKSCHDTFLENVLESGFDEENSRIIRLGNKIDLERTFLSKPDGFTEIKRSVRNFYSKVKTYREQNDYRYIYHYCSSGSFIGVVNSGSLWFSDLLKMNDPNELISNLALSRSISTEILGSSAVYDKLMEEENNSAMRVFSCSFSRRSDDLNQWRSYSDDGSGVCVGFDKKELEKCLYLLASKQSSFDLFMGPELFNIELVNYDRDDSKRSIYEKFKCLWMDYKLSESKCERNIEVRNQIKSYVWRNSAIHKSYFYRDEEEVRAFVRADLNSAIDIEGGSIRFRDGAYGLTSYIALNVKKAIKEVILGPKCLSSVEDVKYFLKYNGIKAKVSVSSGEYR